MIIATIDRVEFTIQENGTVETKDQDLKKGVESLFFGLVQQPHEPNVFVETLKETLNERFRVVKQIAENENRIN